MFLCAAAITAGARIDDPEYTTGCVSQVPPRASAGISPSRIDKLLDGGIVCFPARTLVGDLTVPFEAVELERREDFIAGARLLAGWVYVLNTEQPLTVMPACFKEARDSGQ